MKIGARCSCGASVEGDLDTVSREFIHRFTLPAGALLAGSPSTEVESRIATFAPDSKDWFLTCPLCGASIRIDPAERTTA